MSATSWFKRLTCRTRGHSQAGRRLLLWPGDHCRQREVQVPRGSLPAPVPGSRVCWHPRDHLQLHHEVRPRHQAGPLRQRCSVRWFHHVPRHCCPHAEGDHRPCPQHHEDQDHRSTREEVLRLNRRLHPGLPLHLPVHVDLQGGVRRVRCLHRPQEVLLDWNNSHLLHSKETST